MWRIRRKVPKNKESRKLYHAYSLVSENFEFLTQIYYYVDENTQVKDSLRFIRYLKYPSNLADVKFTAGSQESWTTMIFAELYFAVIERHTMYSLNVSVDNVHADRFLSMSEEELKVCGYFLSLVARNVKDQFVAHTDARTNLINMKFFYTSIDLQTRRMKFNRPVLFAGQW